MVGKNPKGIMSSKELRSLLEGSGTVFAAKPAEMDPLETSFGSR